MWPDPPTVTDVCPPPMSMTAGRTSPSTVTSSAPDPVLSVSAADGSRTVTVLPAFGVDTPRVAKFA